MGNRSRSAERQATYRRKKKEEGGINICLWVSKKAHTRLKALAKRGGLTLGEVVERLSLTSGDKVL